MKPTFALSLDHDGVALHHRAGRGWREVGAVSLDDPAFTDTLALLRTTALGLDKKGLTTKLVLPDSQVLYTEIAAPGPDARSRRRQIAEALEGRTPYEVADLVFDWSGEGTTVQVAVVARETLEEAEAFALAHRLCPVSFVASPEGDTFAGEPFFGPTRSAPDHIGAGEKVERDSRPLRPRRVDGSAAPADAVEPPPPPPEAEATGPAPSVTVLPEPAPAAGVAPVSDPAPEPETPPAPAPVAAPDPEPQPAPTPPPAPEPAPEAQAAPEPAPRPEPEPGSATPPAPAPPGAAPTGQNPAAAEAGGAPALAFASRRTGGERTIAASVLDPAVPAPEGRPSLRAARAAARPGPPPPSTAPRLPQARPAPGTGAPAVDGAAPAKGRGPAPRPGRGAMPAGEAAGSAPAGPPPPATEAEALTVFGARRQVQAPPRRRGGLALLLTLAFLAVMAAIAVWALAFRGSEAVLRTPEAPAEVAAADPAPADATSADTGATPDPVTAPDPVTRQDPDAAAAPVTTPDPVAASGPAAPAAAPEAPAGEVAVARPVAPLARDGGALDPAEGLAPEAALAPRLFPGPALGLAPQAPAGGAGPEATAPTAPTGAMPVPEPEAPAAVAVAARDVAPQVDAAPPPAPPTAADVAVAADAPLPPQPPRPASLDALYLAAIDPGLRSVGPAAPRLGAVNGTPPLLPQRAPLSAAEASATVTPGRPPVVPPPRPRTVPEAAPADVAPEAPGAPAPAPAVPAIRPPARPAELVRGQAAPPASPAPANLAALMALRPAMRPGVRPSPAPAPVAPAAAPAAGPGAIALSAPADVVEGDGEPEAAVARATPTPTSVADLATEESVLPRREMSLIGVFGTASSRRALVRLAGGRMEQVQVGDRLDGGQVAAIDATRLIYVKNGRNVVLELVGG